MSFPFAHDHDVPLYLAPMAGVLVDRWDRKRVMVICSVARGVVLMAVPYVDSVRASAAARRRAD